MDLSKAVFTFIVAWFICLFFVGPFFVRPVLEKRREEYVAAPQPMPWKRFLLINTLVSLTITAMFALIASLNIISFRDDW